MSAARTPARRIAHRDAVVSLNAGPGERIVSLAIEVPTSSRDHRAEALRSLAKELLRPDRPLPSETTVMAAWWDPAVQAVRMRLRIPHGRYAAWLNATPLQLSPTRAFQRVDDRLDVAFAAGMRFADRNPLPPIDLSSDDDGTDSAPAIPRRADDPGLATRHARRPTVDSHPPRRLARRLWEIVRALPLDPATAAIMIAACVVGRHSPIGAAVLGVAFVAVLVDALIGFGAIRLAMRSRTRRADGIHATPAIDADPLPWDEASRILVAHAPSRTEGVARAEMRIRTLLDPAVHSVDPAVVDARARIGNGIRDLVAAHRAPAAIADASERGALAERLADAIEALGVEAEDARLLAFRDARFDFDARTRYLAARAEPGLRLDDVTKDAR